MALARLRLKLALEHRLPARRVPSQCWQSRCRGHVLVISPSHDDFPTLLAEALDQLAANGFALPPAAVVLGVTPTQLLKLFKRSPQAWTVLNRLRSEAGLPALR
jgi:hypothetical protein